MFDNTYRMKQREITATRKQYAMSWMLLAKLKQIPENKLLPLYVHTHTKEGELKPPTTKKVIPHLVEMNGRVFLHRSIRNRLRNEVHILMHVCKNRQVYEVLKFRKHVPEGLTKAVMMSRISDIRTRYRSKVADSFYRK